MKYDISVVMGSKNRKNLIKATINSIRNNGFNGNIEIIVVDGGSTDGSCDWLAKQKDVFTIIQPNYSIVNEKGIKVRAHSWGEFMNIGFKATHSDYICMVSDDLILAPGCLQKGYDEMRSRIENGEKIGGGAFYFREYPRRRYYRIISIFNHYVNINHGFYYKPALEAVGWLDEVNYNFYHGDADITMRLHESGWDTIALNDSFALHLAHMLRKEIESSDWYIEDTTKLMNKYATYGNIGGIIKHQGGCDIDAKPFWLCAPQRVVGGFVMSYLEKLTGRGVG